MSHLKGYDRLWVLSFLAMLTLFTLTASVSVITHFQLKDASILISASLILLCIANAPHWRGVFNGRVVHKKHYVWFGQQSQTILMLSAGIIGLMTFVF